jgi:pantetheine-phosphate adenylyltransferase
MSDRHYLYPGTFDPFTRGHLDILERGLALCDRVTVAVAAGGKTTLLDRDERIELARGALAGLAGADRCRVTGFDGLLVDAARDLGATAVLRGVRSPSDLEHEQTMAALNRVLSPGFEVVVLFPRPELAMISSTLVRDVARCDGALEAFVTPGVAAALRRRFPRG